jgi:hypothetical protein
MKWSRKQFTMRLMMTVIAISGLVMGGIRLKNLQDNYQQKAAKHAYGFSIANDMIKSQLDYIDFLEVSLDHKQTTARIQRGPAHTNDLPSPEDCEQQIKEVKMKMEKGRLDIGLLSKRAEYHKRLNIKYTNASRRPWVLIEPDETPPPLPTFP